MSDRWDDLRKRTWALRLELPEAVADDYCPRVFDLLAERDTLAARCDTLAAEVERLRAVIDCCPFDDTPLQHDDDNPRLGWWCGTCGHITERPSALAALTEETTDE